jgi:hypothetical protein
MIDTQQHPLADGKAINIYRNGNHQYWLDGGPRVKSVTSVVKHVEGDTFGVGMNWALKVARENGGDLNAPRLLSKEAAENGVRLHEAVDTYIKHGTITEDPTFMSWYNELGREEWLASEIFLYHSNMLFGGTADAVSLSTDGTVTLFDWKTVDPSSWQKYGASLRLNKDSAQVAAYAAALSQLGSVYAPLRGYVAYIMRDGSGTEVVEVNLKRGLALFNASRELFLLTTGGE